MDKAKYIVIILFFVINIIFVTCMFRDSSGTMSAIVKMAPGMDLTFDKLILCDKSENNCKLTKLTISDMLDMSSSVQKNDMKQLNDKISNMEDRVKKGDEQFAISDIEKIYCQPIEATRKITETYSQDKGNHNVVYHGTPKHPVYISETHYNLLLTVKGRNIDLDTYVKQDKCEYVRDDVKRRLNELSNNGYTQIFGGGINDSPEEKARKKAEMDAMFANAESSK